MTREEIAEGKTELFFTPQELVTRWRMDSAQTLANQRHQGIGPPHVKLKTGKVLYRVSDVLSYERGGMRGLSFDTVARAVQSAPWLSDFEQRQLIAHIRAEIGRRG